MVAQGTLGHRGGELASGELWAVIGQHPGELDPDTGKALGDVVDEGRGVTG
jgi:hypothetical protein